MGNTTKIPVNVRHWGRREEPEREEDAGSKTGSEASVAYGVMGEPYIPGTAKEESMIALACAAAEKRRLREVEE